MNEGDEICRASESGAESSPFFHQTEEGCTDDCIAELNRAYRQKRKMLNKMDDEDDDVNDNRQPHSDRKKRK